MKIVSKTLTKYEKRDFFNSPFFGLVYVIFKVFLRGNFQDSPNQKMVGMCRFEFIVDAVIENIRTFGGEDVVDSVSAFVGRKHGIVVIDHHDIAEGLEVLEMRGVEVARHYGFFAFGKFLGEGNELSGAGLVFFLLIGQVGVEEVDVFAVYIDNGVAEGALFEAEAFELGYLEGNYRVFGHNGCAVFPALMVDAMAEFVILIGGVLGEYRQGILVSVAGGVHIDLLQADDIGVDAGKVFGENGEIVFYVRAVFDVVGSDLKLHRRLGNACFGGFLGIAAGNEGKETETRE